MTRACVLPFCLYLLGTVSVGEWDEFYPFGYAAVVVIVGGLTWRLMRGRGIVAPHRNVSAGIILGILGAVVWIALSELRLEAWLATFLPSWLRPEDRVGYNPSEHLVSPVSYWGFLLIRFAGLVVLVPIVEEPFWRGFLARWLKNPDWESVPLGQFTAGTFLGVVLLFTLAHPEWLAAAVYCSLLNGLLIWKRDLWNCIVAHAVSNLALGIYVLTTSSWWLW